MDRNLVQFKNVGLSILIAVVLISGCIDSSKSTQEIKEAKVINFSPQEIILSDIEIKDVLGNEWNVVADFSIIDDSIGRGLVYDNPSRENGYVGWSTDGNESLFLPIYISLYIYPDVFEAKEIYRYHDLFSKKIYKGNELNITDTGSIYFWNKYQSTIIKEIFRKNNVISIIYFDTSKSNALNIDSAFNLSKKQEAKIDRFLEMIK